MSAPLQVWRFGEAPAQLQALSDAGGDEDLVVLVPRSWQDPGVLDQLPEALYGLLGSLRHAWDAWGRIHHYPQADGTLVVITSHS